MMVPLDSFSPRVRRYPCLLRLGIRLRAEPKVQCGDVRSHAFGALHLDAETLLQDNAAGYSLHAVRSHTQTHDSGSHTIRLRPRCEVIAVLKNHVVLPTPCPGVKEGSLIPPCRMSSRRILGSAASRLAKRSRTPKDNTLLKTLTTRR
jgi:hypothetical protein